MSAGFAIAVIVVGGLVGVSLVRRPETCVASCGSVRRKITTTETTRLTSQPGSREAICRLRAGLWASEGVILASRAMF